MTDPDSRIDTDGEVEIEREATTIDDVNVDGFREFDRGGLQDRSTTRSERPTDSNSGWLRSRIESRFSTTSYLTGTVLSIGGVLAAGSFPLPGPVGDLLGIFIALFVVGLAFERQHYLESALAGATVGAGSMLVGSLLFGILGLGPLLLLIGFFGGAIAGATGHYFGRDLRDGLTRDLTAPE